MKNTTKKYFLPFIVLAIATTISSCNSTPTTRQETVSNTPAPLSPSPTPSPTTGELGAKPEATPTPAATKSPTAIAPANTSPVPAAKTTNVTLYTSDDQCQDFIPQKVPVASEEPVNGAVGKILEQRESGDISLSSYRVNVKNGVATVDLRLAPNSKRQLASLSSCEQFALFGSLRKTLTSNAQWNIKDVRFTQSGKEIVF
jgi:hypothetical protein